jgi:outer membrane protein assembly factor BamE (lipoprotein component of BamABCDE complex)
MNSAGQGSYMANPFEDLDKPDPGPSKRRRRSGAGELKPHKGPLLQSLAILSFFGPFIVAPIVWLMAHQDLKEMAGGRMDRAGRPQTRTARRLAVISTCGWALLVALFLAYQFIAGGVLFPAAASHRITRTEFERVQAGMTKKQVTEILGQPARTGYRGDHLTWYWHEKDGRATFSLDFDDQDRVRDQGIDTPDYSGSRKTCARWTQARSASDGTPAIPSLALRACVRHQFVKRNSFGEGGSSDG